MSFAFYYSTPTIKYLDPFTEKSTFARSINLFYTVLTKDNNSISCRT